MKQPKTLAQKLRQDLEYARSDLLTMQEKQEYSQAMVPMLQARLTRLQGALYIAEAEEAQAENQAKSVPVKLAFLRRLVTPFWPIPT